MDKMTEANKVFLTGRVLTGPSFSHKAYGEAFYIMTMGISRKSGYEDKIKLLVPEKVLGGKSPREGAYIEIIGQIRTYNHEECGRNRLIINVFVRQMTYCRPYDICSNNRVELEGFLCKVPIRRVSPLGREICDLMIAVNRAYNKSDYIPAIAWGKNAYRCEEFDVGDKVKIRGRIQSREYKKHIDEGDVIIKTAYEVSIADIDVI